MMRRFSARRDSISSRSTYPSIGAGGFFLQGLAVLREQNESGGACACLQTRQIARWWPEEENLREYLQEDFNVIASEREAIQRPGMAAFADAPRNVVILILRN
jgi:hypothetical protein